MSKEKPILFSTPMVRAILAGRKTVTRRVIKPQPPSIGQYRFSNPPYKAFWNHLHKKWWLTPLDVDEFDPSPRELYEYACPYGQPGDRLWVRETWRKLDCPQHDEGQPPGTLCLCNQVQYRADGDSDGKWRPSIFMPRWASRVTLEITGVRIERLQEISEADAIAEGVEARGPNHVVGARYRFGQLWNPINAKRGYGWEANPWVWVVEFKRVES